MSKLLIILLTLATLVWMGYMTYYPFFQMENLGNSKSGFIESKTKSRISVQQAIELAQPILANANPEKLDNGKIKYNERFGEIWVYKKDSWYFITTVKPYEEKRISPSLANAIKVNADTGEVIGSNFVIK